MTSISSLPAVILLIDEDPLTLTAMSAVLHVSGHECHMARDGEAALKAVRGLSLDLLICDVTAEGGAAVELGRELVAEPTAREVPIIFISPTEESREIAAMRAAGDAYHLQRPFASNELVDLVETALWMPHLLGKHRSKPRPAGCQPVSALPSPSAETPTATPASQRVRPRRRSSVR